MAQLSQRKKLVSAGVLVLIVCASATQTELANVSRKREIEGKEEEIERHHRRRSGAAVSWRKSYLTHSVFTIIFPAHLLILRISRGHARIRTYLRNIWRVTADQLFLRPDQVQEIYRRLGKTILWLTALLSLPAISWYAAVPLTGTTDLTTLYATATFWTYGFSLLLLKTRLSSLTLTAIMVAFLGVAVITYSGASSESFNNHTTPDDDPAAVPSSPSSSSKGKEPPHRVLGDLIMLTGAICLGFYEVIYKMTLPEGHGGVVPAGQARDSTTTANHYEAVSTTTMMTLDDEDDEALDQPPKSMARPTLSVDDSRSFSSLPLVKPDLLSQELKLPLALHANFLTSLIGIATLLLFWIPIPFLHWTGLEEFALPRSGDVGLLAVICTMGATYNAGFMCLIGLLGPVTASVANLLAIGLVALIDAVYLGRAIPFWTLCGALLVAAGFGVLLYQGEGEGETSHDNVVDIHHAKDDDADEP